MNSAERELKARLIARSQQMALSDNERSILALLSRIEDLERQVFVHPAEMDGAEQHIKTLNSRIERLTAALWKGGCGRDERCYRCAQCEREDRALAAEPGERAT